jgi:hypothetical protein
MLTISQPLSSSQAQKYHAEEFTSRSQAYYAAGKGNGVRKKAADERNRSERFRHSTAVRGFPDSG